MRATPFSLAFGEIEPRFPAIAEALQQDGAAPTDRDRFVLLEPVGRLLREIVPEDAGADALEAHVLLLHHAYLFWAAEQPVYQITDQTLRRAVGEKRITTRLPHAAQYLQLPELRVWGSPNEVSPPEPLDGMFVRAPYLHNASVLTLAELINLKKRRDVFMRGDDLYDPADVGFSPPTAKAADQYFKFDTALTGNSNRGHDYPWAYDDPRRNVDDLAALLDYLKTL